MGAAVSRAGDRKRRTELHELARVVALAMSAADYLPTIRDQAQADAFDAAMAAVGDRRRAWRGSLG